jgi:hypothetical protein
MKTATNRYQNISQMAGMFALSRDTVRKRLRAAKVKPHSQERNAPVYDMAIAGPALFANMAPY